MYILHVDNVFQRTIYTLASITINIRNRHTFPKPMVTQIESNTLLEISSFYKNKRIDKSRKNRDEETK